MARTAILAIQIITDASKGQAGLKQTATSVDRFASGMQKAAVPAAIMGGALFALGKQSVKAASDLQQATGAVESVFGSQSAAVVKFSETSAERLGIAQSAYQQYAAVTGTALQAAGMSASQAVGETDKLMTRSADLAATFGGTTASAIEAINAAVSRSEFDPLEKYGISLNMAAVNAELAKRGQDKLTGSAAASAKQAVILDQIYGKSAKSAGQFARESDSAAGAQQIMTAQWEDAQAALGEALLPAITATAQALADMAKWAQQNAGVVQILAAAVGVLVVAVFAIIGALKVYEATMIVINAVQKATWLSNPIFLVIAAVVLLVIAIVMLWRKHEGFRNAVMAIWNAVKAAAVSAWTVIKTVALAVFRALSAMVQGYAAIFRAVFTVVRAVALAVWNALRAAWNATRSAIVSGIGAVGAYFRGVWQGMRATAIAVWNAIRSAWNTVAAGIRAGVASVRSFFASAWAGLRSIASGVWNSVLTTVQAVLSRIRSAISGAAGAIRGAFAGLSGVLSAPFDAAQGAINRLIGLIESLINKIRNIPKPNIPGLSLLKAPIPAAPAGVGLRAAPTMGRAAMAGGGNVYITVQGAIDVDSTARQIERILRRRGRRIGSVDR